MSGIMSSNPFHVIQNLELLDMSSKLGVSINEVDDTVCFNHCSDLHEFVSLKNSDKNNSCI
jgi:hypothetical protein